MIDPRQLRGLVEKVLTQYSLHSPAAVELILGTIAVESAGGRYIRQIKGPALGIVQMEPATYRWLVQKYRLRFPMLLDRPADDLEWDLRLCILMCRLRYFAVPTFLPKAADTAGLAAYWKKWYNTPLGAGTVEKFEDAYWEFVR